MFVSQRVPYANCGRPCGTHRKPYATCQSALWHCGSTLDNCQRASCHCRRAFWQLPKCRGQLPTPLQSPISSFAPLKALLKRPEGPCSKSFSERCALQGLPEGVLSPNAAKSASLVTNVPCKPLYEGYFHQTILNNCHESSTSHIGYFRTIHVRS